MSYGGVMQGGIFVEYRVRCDGGHLAAADCLIQKRMDLDGRAPEGWVERDDPFGRREQDGTAVRLHLCPACQRMMAKPPEENEIMGEERVGATSLEERRREAAGA